MLICTVDYGKCYVVLFLSAEIAGAKVSSGSIA